MYSTNILIAFFYAHNSCFQARGSTIFEIKFCLDKQNPRIAKQ